MLPRWQGHRCMQWHHQIPHRRGHVIGIYARASRRHPQHGLLDRLDDPSTRRLPSHNPSASSAVLARSAGSGRGWRRHRIGIRPETGELVNTRCRSGLLTAPYLDPITPGLCCISLARACVPRWYIAPSRQAPTCHARTITRVPSSAKGPGAWAD